ncbi:MAG: preprotein translocase subunit TatB [Candidatus Brocadia sp.]|uniref:Response regulator sirA n=1 Tax=Candidatus Brocadia fulgida TaxID=380242 RepID=A0A0M2UVA6_9BACT|nr:MAG: response regulator sirA [Candidatus Brocadia fulgida]MCC6324345.1 sulfurtransferase TusA family protein [Candidatus Brocadia sp.]MCE7912165.1 sulfurtransferase TusA family protein [Candidatus Brocadia sp. AMX3]OQY98779.1 MAG: preprotein translocase subunit TatB [Candidatus Brocadia sp. UTAMX2]MBV6519133.1 Sulfurtransferase TusA [Candidatus Brocadia fulgida]
MTEEEKMAPDDKIDLRGVLCPINFVKTKLKLEMMDSGQVLEVILDDGEPIRSVPRSIKEEGHKIVKVENLEGGYRLLIKKS